MTPKPHSELAQTVRSALDYGSDFPGHEALDSLLGQIEALNAENASLNAENRDLLEKWSARGTRIDRLVEQGKLVERERDEWEERYEELLSSVGGVWPG